MQENNLPSVIGPQELKQIQALGQIFKASGFFKDIRDEAQAVTKILYGAEIGFTPIVSITGIFIVDGKPTLSANLLATMVKRSGKYDYRVLENSADRCIILFRQRNDDGKWEDIGKTEFSMEDAKAAGVAGKDVWRKYAKAMLFSRALSAGVRAHCPDVTSSPMYIPEELGANVNGEGDIIEATKPVIAEPIKLERPVKQPEPELVAEAVDRAEPTVVAPQPKVQPPPTKFITEKQAGMIGRRFRESLREDLQSLAEPLRHDALRVNGYIDNDGNPSSYAIPADKFEEAGKKLVAYAQQL